MKVDDRGDAGYLNVVLALQDGRIAMGAVRVVTREEAQQFHSELGKVLGAPVAATVLPGLPAGLSGRKVA